MIRSSRIPSILHKALLEEGNNSGGGVQTALLVTTDGELLGSTSTSKTTVKPELSMESLGTLIADIAVDYSRMGEEYAALDITSSGESGIPKSSHLQCLLLEMEVGLVAVSMCTGVDCMVIAICAPETPAGHVKARLQAITEYVQEALSPLTAGGGGDNNNMMVPSSYG